MKQPCCQPCHVKYAYGKIANEGKAYMPQPGATEDFSKAMLAAGLGLDQLSDVALSALARLQLLEAVWFAIWQDLVLSPNTVARAAFGYLPGSYGPALDNELHFICNTLFWKHFVPAGKKLPIEPSKMWPALAAEGYSVTPNQSLAGNLLELFRSSVNAQTACPGDRQTTASAPVPARFGWNTGFRANFTLGEQAGLPESSQDVRKDLFLFADKFAGTLSKTGGFGLLQSAANLAGQFPMLGTAIAADVVAMQTNSTVTTALLVDLWAGRTLPIPQSAWLPIDFQSLPTLGEVGAGVVNAAKGDQQFWAVAAAMAADLAWVDDATGPDGHVPGARFVSLAVQAYVQLRTVVVLCIGLNRPLPYSVLRQVLQDWSATEAALLAPKYANAQLWFGAALDWHAWAEAAVAFPLNAKAP